MSAGKNIGKNIIDDIAGRIEQLIEDARAYIARSRICKNNSRFVYVKIFHYICEGIIIFERHAN